MNSKKPLLIIGLVIIVLAVLAFLYSKKSTTPETGDTNQQTTTTQTQPEEEKPTNQPSSLLDILKTKQTLNCKYSSSAGGMTTTGDIYISGEKIHADLETKSADDTTILNHMVSDGTYMYSWSSASNQGIKMNYKDMQDKYTNTETSGSSDKPSNNADLLFENMGNYQCNPWIEDPTTFHIDDDIQFTDLSQTMKNMENTMCMACDYMQNESEKAACKTQYKCN
jgi:hypothetical protein